MPNADSDSREITPRNIVWVEDMPPGFKDGDYDNLRISHYTHAIICSFHLSKELNLFYNDLDLRQYWPYNDSWWKYLHSLRIGDQQKTLMLSVGGWNSGTWKNANAQGQEETAAARIVKFAQGEGFAGIDFNFEGDEPEEGYQYPERGDILTTFARMAVGVRHLWRDGLFTITPIWDEAGEQLGYIRPALGGAPLSDLLSWINVQFYKGLDFQKDVPGAYDYVLAQYGLEARMVAAGFPLSETNVAFNWSELERAKTAVEKILSKHPLSDFAGMFVWRFRGAFIPANLDWALTFSKILHGP